MRSSDTVQHDLHAEGEAFRLRPVRLSDAELIVELRTDPVLSRYLHPVSADVARQRVWLETYFAREGDYYFIVEARDGAPQGTVGIYDLDDDRRTAEWGRWILRHGSLAAIESARLVYTVSFDVLSLAEVYCRTVAENAPVVSFHDSCGLARASSNDEVELDGRKLSMVRHVLTRDAWPRCDAHLHSRAKRIARMLSR